MAPAKETGRARRKGSAGEGKRERTGGAVEKDTERGRDATMVDVDPWGAFFENFWGRAEGESTDGPDGGREPPRGPRATGTKPGRRGRSPRAS